MTEDSLTHGGAALLAALGSESADWADARVPHLLAWMRAGGRRFELQALLHSSVGALQTLTAAHARGLLELLGDWGMLDAARMVSSLPRHCADPQIATVRARLAMQARDYRAAIEASDVAIGALLQPELSVEEFLRLCIAGAPAEGMLRFERQVVGSRLHLSERLALRWEALHRAGMTRDASMMQLMCQRYFPERASVWATAGNHALDADDLVSAEAYFQRCLQLEPNWTAGLAGLAIVCERRKDWAAALPYRRRVLEVEKALERDDAASLQRTLRYAAALARLGRWREAEPLFRAAARAKALAQLPAEVPVLVRVFSQDLYAPGLVAALRGEAERGTNAPVSSAAHARHGSEGTCASAAQAEQVRADATAASAARPNERVSDKTCANAPRPNGRGSDETCANAARLNGRGSDETCANAALAERVVADATAASAPRPNGRGSDETCANAAQAERVGADATAASAARSDGHGSDETCANAARPNGRGSDASCASAPRPNGRGSDASCASAARPNGRGSDASAARAGRVARAENAEPAVLLAQHEAALLGQLGFAARELAGNLGAQRWMLALCAYLAGELEHAYAMLDHVEVDRPDDVALHYLLWRCASAIGHSQTASIRSFAEKAARDVQAMPGAHSELQRSYAAALVPGTGRRVHAQQAMPLAAAGAPAAHSEPPPTAGGQARPAATEDAPESAAPLVATALDLATLEPVQGSALAQLEHIVAFRALHEAADGSPLAAAAASALALTALVTSVTSK